MSRTMRSWKNAAYALAGLLTVVLVIAGLTDTGEGGAAADLLLVPVLVGGLALIMSGALMGASPTHDGVRVRRFIRTTTIPFHSVAHVRSDEMEMLPISWCRVVVTDPCGNEHDLVQFAQYGFIERRLGGVQKKADRLNTWLRAGLDEMSG